MYIHILDQPLCQPEVLYPERQYLVKWTLVHCAFAEDHNITWAHSNDLTCNYKHTVLWDFIDLQSMWIYAQEFFNTLQIPCSQLVSVFSLEYLGSHSVAYEHTYLIPDSWAHVKQGGAFTDSIHGTGKLSCSYVTRRGGTKYEVQDDEIFRLASWNARNDHLPEFFFGRSIDEARTRKPHHILYRSNQTWVQTCLLKSGVLLLDARINLPICQN